MGIMDQHVMYLNARNYMLSSMSHAFEILIYLYLPNASGIEKQISKEQGEKILLVQIQDLKRSSDK